MSADVFTFIIFLAGALAGVAITLDVLVTVDVLRTLCVRSRRPRSRKQIDLPRGS